MFSHDVVCLWRLSLTKLEQIWYSMSLFGNTNQTSKVKLFCFSHRQNFLLQSVHRFLKILYKQYKISGNLWPFISGISNKLQSLTEVNNFLHISRDAAAMTTATTTIFGFCLTGQFSTENSPSGQVTQSGTFEDCGARYFNRPDAEPTAWKHWKDVS